MNERNVAALEAAINAVCDDMKRLGLDAVTNELLANELAARGVLVPSAMTEADSIDAGEWPIERQIAALERIAKGEP